MATYSININEKTNDGKALLNYLLSIGVLEPKSAEKKNGCEETLQAIKDVKAGRGRSYKDLNEFKERMHAL